MQFFPNKWLVVSPSKHCSLSSMLTNLSHTHTVRVTSYYRNSGEVSGSSLRFSVNGQAANRETSAPCLQTLLPVCKLCALFANKCERLTRGALNWAKCMKKSVRSFWTTLPLVRLNKHCTVKHTLRWPQLFPHVCILGNDSDGLTLYIRTSLWNVSWRTWCKTFHSLRIYECSVMLCDNSKANRLRFHGRITDVCNLPCGASQKTYAATPQLGGSNLWHVPYSLCAVCPLFQPYCGTSNSVIGADIRVGTHLTLSVIMNWHLACLYG